MAKTSYEDAVKAQAEAKEAVKTAKAKLTTYFKENGLKRNKDYSKDKTHSKALATLEKGIKKATATLEKWNEKVTQLKGEAKTTKAKGTRTKYDYPPEIDTAEKRKKYRQQMRAKAAGKTPKETKAKETKAKATKTKATKAKAKAAEPKKSADKKSTKAKASKVTKAKASKSKAKATKKEVEQEDD